LGFILKKVSEYGTSNPIVARTSVQVNNLLQPFSIPQPNKERIFEIYFTMVQPKLIRCMEITNRIYAEIDKIDAELREHGIKTQSGGRVLELPQITQLQEDVETYLYNAKSALRDLALVFDPFFGKSFDHSRYQEISKWALDNFGEGEPLPVLLAADQEWIKDIVKRRNAVEHPGGYSGHLHIENYQVASIEGTEAQHIIPPTWRLNDDKPTLLLPDLSVTLSNLLEFAEDLLVACLKQHGSRFPIVFYEILEEERDASAPVRLGVTIDIKQLKT
jgi:hypothetical protein